MRLIHHLDAIKPVTSLTPRQQEFCIQFVLTNSKAKAARLSGYASNNSSSIGCRLLKRLDIQHYVEALRSEAVCQRNVPTPASITSEYTQVENQSAVSLAAFLDLTGGVLRLRNPEDLAEHCIGVLENIVFDADGRIAGYRLKQGGVPSLQRMMELAGLDTD